MILDDHRGVFETHRRTTWRVWLCDSKDQLVRELDEFTGGSIEHNRNRAVRGGGSLDLTGDLDTIDWGRARFRVEQLVDGIDQPIPWGVYLPEKPDAQHQDEQGVSSTTVRLMDKLLILDQDSPTDTYSLAAGTNIVTAVVAILNGLGETRYAASPSTLTLPTDRVWQVSDADVTWLTIVNDLLAIAGFFSLWCDGDGIYRIGPYRPSTVSDEAAWTFVYNDAGEGPSSLYVPSWGDSEDWYSVPNRVTLVSQGSETAPAMVATATNANPESKYSTVRRGRTITLRETGIEAASLAVLQDLAARRLQSLTTSVSNIQITTAPLPLWPNDRVDLVSPSRESVVQATVSSWTLPLESGGLMTHSWREVQTL